jgi:type II secretory pathway pseudopilin PulG
MRRAAMTLLELLIVITIISLLIQLALPAIQMSREAARRAQCSNNLRQIALAFQHHHGTHGHYPSSGWGWQWVGHPERGYGSEQPGGWAYNVLPFLEEQRIRELGVGLPDGSREQQLALLQANASPIPLFICPSRRSPRLFPVVISHANDVLGFSPLLPDECLRGDGGFCQVARSDYAVNAGNLNPIPGNEAGPNSPGDASTWDWRYSGPDSEAQNGVSFQRSKVKTSQVIDGLGKTYCVGEKYVPRDDYETGIYQNDDLSIFVGHDGDMNRYTADSENSQRSITDDNASAGNQHFGSAHASVFYMSYCDGSVHPVAYEIDPEPHRLMGGRDDGTASAPMP